MTCQVVVVDDADDLRELICLVLERRGQGAFEVVGTAGDGAAASEVVTATQPDLVLMDIAMPVMDGLQALPYVRLASPHSLVVMLSGFPAATAAAGALEAGADAYLEKNDLVRTLVPQLREIVASRA